MSIRGVHTIMFGEDAEAIRAFLRDVLDLDYVEAGGGWPIFKLPPTELAAHPSETSGHYELYLMCDDIEETRAELEGKGVEFDGTGTRPGLGARHRDAGPRRR